MGRHYKKEDKKFKAGLALALVTAAALALALWGGEQYFSRQAEVQRPAAEHSAGETRRDETKSLDITAASKDEGKEPAEDQNEPSAKPLLAVIIDDGGTQMELTRRVAALSLPVTWAIMPWERYSQQAAITAKKHGTPFLVHLPMQAIADKNTSEYLVGVSTDRQEIVEICSKALDSLPEAIGISNHRGSRATADKTTMEPVMEVLKDRGLAFVDSRTNGDSAAYDTAIAAGIPSVMNSGFLDNTPDKAAISARFEEAVRTAQKKGSAVMICHFRPVTVMFLEELDKRYKELPVKLVTIPDMFLLQKIIKQGEELQ